jgi:hypothetical protein
MCRCIVVRPNIFHIECAGCDDVVKLPHVRCVGFVSVLKGLGMKKSLLLQSLWMNNTVL